MRIKAVSVNEDGNDSLKSRDDDTDDDHVTDTGNDKFNWISNKGNVQTFVIIDKKTFIVLSTIF